MDELVNATVFQRATVTRLIPPGVSWVIFHNFRKQETDKSDNYEQEVVLSVLYERLVCGECGFIVHQVAARMSAERKRR